MFRVPTYQVGQGFIRGTVLAAGDFNGDGRSDLAVGSFEEVEHSFKGGLFILLGRDDGTFDPPIQIESGALPEAIVVGDFDGDGHQDVAAANAIPIVGDICLCVPPPNGYVSILLGRGDGTFGQPRHFAVGSGPASLVVGDFDGDGRQDLAVANSFGESLESEGDVSILPGLGDGTFGPQRRFAAGARPSSISVGDFDEDGQQDLVVANYASNDVSVLLGHGDGTFGAEARFAAGQAPLSVAVGDFNRDGQSDLAVANNLSNDVSIMPGSGDGTFTTQVRYGAGEGPFAMTLGDFNGDGQQDVAVADAGSGEVSVLLGQGDGSLERPISCGAGLGPSSIAPGRFNRDGRLDLAVSNAGGVAFALLGRGDGGFMTASRYKVGMSPSSLAIGDFNGDRRDDLVVANSGGSDVSILLGRDDGTFGHETRDPVGSSPRSVTIGTSTAMAARTWRWQIRAQATCPSCRVEVMGASAPRPGSR